MDTSPQKAHTPTPTTGKSIALHGKRDLVDVIKITDVKMRMLPGWPGEPNPVT